MSESAVLAAVRLALSKAGARMFRNNVARAWVGKPYHIARRQQIWVNAGDVVLQNARPLHAGLHVGSGDLIGWKSVLVVPEMVGTRIAVFTSVETKSALGRERDAQAVWRIAVEQAGGIAILARSAEEAVAGLS